MTSPKTLESLNCPCNGIYKCGLHSRGIFEFCKNPQMMMNRISKEVDDS